MKSNRAPSLAEFEVPVEIDEIVGGFDLWVADSWEGTICCTGSLVDDWKDPRPDG